MIAVGRLLIISLAVLCISSELHAQIITTFVGGGTAPGDNVPATSVEIGYPGFGGFDSNGNYYVGANLAGATVRMVDNHGIIHTAAGNGTSGYGGDGGPATACQLRSPYAIPDLAGNIYIADWYNNRVRKVTASTGIINTIAGNGTGTSTGDGGPATAATLAPLCLCLDNLGNIYIYDVGTGSAIRKIDTSGIISTVAGNTSTSGYSGDGGPATAAKIAVNFAICTDIHGDLYMGCPGRIRKVDMHTGIINTIAGTGIAAYNGDGMHSDSANFQPYVIAIDVWGNIYIGDWNQRVRKIDTFNIIHTIAGTEVAGTCGFSGDGGPADSAKICDPEGLSFDACGNLYLADDGNERIRKIALPANPFISISGITTGAVGDTITVTANVVYAGYSYTIHWLNNGIPFATTTIPNVSYIKTQNTDSITAVVYGCSDSALSGVHVVTNSKAGVPMSKLENIIISPNPVTNELHINNLLQTTTCQLHNIIGTTVAQGILNAGNNTLFVHDLPPGLYILEIVDENGVREVRKVVKE